MQKMLLLSLSLLPLLGYPSAKAVDNTLLKNALNKRESATATLQQFCKNVIYIHHIPENNLQNIPSDVLNYLKVTNKNTIRVRHVQLKCASITFSEAWNYYVPARLPDKIQEILLNTHTPFGRAVGEKNFIRHALETKDFSSNSPFILQNQAVLLDIKTQQPIAFVIENYTKAAEVAAQNYK